MGLRYRPGNSCVVSTFRLKANNKPLFYKRLEKVLHELGHNLGLPHCENPKCVMTSAAEKISTIDNANASLCDACAKRIR
jgi:archaemetzincin